MMNDELKGKWFSVHHSSFIIHHFKAPATAGGSDLVALDVLLSPNCKPL